MRPAVVVLGAIGTIEITAIRHVKTALQRFAVEETLTRFQNVVAGKFAADVFENLHAVWTGQTLSVATIFSRRNKGEAGGSDTVRKRLLICSICALQ
jgi:hypothetical protein